MHVSLILEIDLSTLSMGVGLKLPPFTNPICGQMGRSCPDVSKKVWHLYVSLLEFEMALLTLFMGVEITPDINPIYVGLETSKNVSYVGVGLV